jgi:alanine-synthesizing transaminase
MPLLRVGVLPSNVTTPLSQALLPQLLGFPSPSMLSSPLPMFSDRTSWPLSRNRFTIALDELRAAGVPLLDLTASNPTQCGFHYESTAILSAFQNPSVLAYDPQPKGILAARQDVSRYYLDDHHTTLDPESLLLTTSTSEAYSHAFRLLCNPGDEILLPKPSYPLFEFLAGLQDVNLIPYFLAYAHGWFIDFQSLESAITPRTRAILLVHPNNPTGSYVRPEELARLNALCRGHNLALIVDEVFLDFAFDDAPRKTFAANSEALTCTLSGLSKIAALPQMKIAWLAVTGPSDQVRPALDRLEIIADTYLSLSAPAQAALPALLAQRHSLRPQLLARIRENLAQLQSLLVGQFTCELLHADAGWYAVLRLTAPSSDEDLAIHLLREHHVILHPGHFYDFPSDGHLVLSLIIPPPTFAHGVQKLLTSL